MTLSVGLHCKGCGKYSLIVPDNGRLSCPACQRQAGRIEGAFDFESCPLCECRQFYAQKDFNQALGCLVMLLGIVLVPWTYGLSLPVFALVDWLMYRRIETIAVCYRCGSEFKGLPVPKHLKNFMHHIGEKYERRAKNK